MLELLTAGLGVALVPASAQNLRRMGVAYKLLKEPLSTIKLSLVWRKHNLSPALQAFLSVARQKND
jgi:DNA-binding transcriptional LysR family regulator